MKRFVFGFLCALALAVAPACGGDDDGGDTGDTGDTADVDSGGGGPSAEATAFCTEYADVCGFTADWYVDMAGCTTAFDGYDAEQQGCVGDHLEFASGEDDGSAEEMMHCGHAAGDAPCN